MGEHGQSLRRELTTAQTTTGTGSTLRSRMAAKIEAREQGCVLLGSSLKRPNWSRRGLVVGTPAAASDSAQHRRRGE
jgi:hypothetical protein